MTPDETNKTRMEREGKGFTLVRKKTKFLDISSKIIDSSGILRTSEALDRR